MDKNHHCDLCAAKSPGIMPLLRECDCRIAALFGNRRGETISGAAAGAISESTGLSQVASMDAFHLGSGASAFAMAGLILGAKPRAIVPLMLTGAIIFFAFRWVKR
jgi:hypothetical protein